MVTNTENLSVEDICKNISDDTGKTVTTEILNLFQKNGLTFKIKDDSSRYRIFCYIT
jgi:hypothetical protein